MRIRRSVSTVVAVALLACGGLYLALRHGNGMLPLPAARRPCEIRAEGTVTLSAEQMANAATIAAVGVRRGIPERGLIVALATAYQESALRNLEGGDRDSIGLFQQRPSKGWGEPAQIRDPRYASRQFYDALRRVRGWEQLRITDAAQRVQRSGFPEAYEKWADEARVLTTALLGQAPGAVACTVPTTPALRGAAAADAIAALLTLDWGELRSEPAQPGGLALPVQDSQAGWRYAHWLVAHATDHGVRRVRFSGQEWTARNGRWSSADADAGRVLAEVFDES